MKIFYALLFYKNGAISVFAQPKKDDVDKEVNRIVDEAKADGDELKVIRFSGGVLQIWNEGLLWRVVKESVSAL